MSPCTVGRSKPGAYRRVMIDGKPVRRHRLAYCKAHGLKLGDIEGLVIRHTCDNPPCDNPEHLLAGTQKDNLLDCHIRGRAKSVENLKAINNKGDRNGLAKLNNKAVLAMRREYAKGKISIRALAVRYGVGKNAAYAVVSRKTWKHI